MDRFSHAESIANGYHDLPNSSNFPPTKPSRYTNNLKLLRSYVRTELCDQNDVDIIGLSQSMLL